MTTGKDEVLEKLVYELLRKVDAYHESLNNKVDNKVDSLELKMCEEIRLLRKDGHDRDESASKEIKALDSRN